MRVVSFAMQACLNYFNFFHFIQSKLSCVSQFVLIIVSNTVSFKATARAATFIRFGSENL